MDEVAFMRGFQEPEDEANQQWAIWRNYLAHEAQWGGMDHDPHDHCDALYNIPYVKAGLALYQEYVPDDARSILEIGCAQGYILNHVGGTDSKRTGIDFNDDRVRKGRAQYPNTEFIVGDVRTMTLEGSYDYVLLPGVLEHMRFQEARNLVEQAVALCAPGGKVLFDLPWWSGKSTDFNSGIHMNPTHAWVGTTYRWDWLFRGIEVQQVALLEYPFYIFGCICNQEPQSFGGILVGCWGKIGDIIHAMPMAQKLARDMGTSIEVMYSPGFGAVDSVLDLLEGVSHYSAAHLVNYEGADLGIQSRWERVVNASYSGGRKDPVRGWGIFGWWDNNYHAIDFAAACARIELTGPDRYLKFKSGVRCNLATDTVVFLSNCGDPGQRGIFADWWPPITQAVRDLGGKPVECSVGSICNGRDLRGVPLGDVIKLMAVSRLVISIDTLASALIAQSLDTPIIRLYTGATRPSMTGVTDVGWKNHRVLVDAKYGEPSSHELAIRYIHELWG